MNAESTEESGYLDSLMVHEGGTLMPPLPFDQSGFHWRAGTTRVQRAVSAMGEMASAVVDGNVVARGVVSDVEVPPTRDAAVVHVGPPYGGEPDEVDAQLVPERSVR